MSESIKPTASLEGFSKDAWSTVALRMLHGQYDTSSSWIGGTIDKCEAALKRIAEARIEYANLEPSRLRHEIMGWLDYYEKGARDNLADCISQKSRKELDNNRAEREKENEEINRLSEALRSVRQ